MRERLTITKQKSIQPVPGTVLGTRDIVTLLLPSCWLVSWGNLNVVEKQFHQCLTRYSRERKGL